VTCLHGKSHVWEISGQDMFDVARFSCENCGARVKKGLDNTKLPMYLWFRPTHSVGMFDYLVQMLSQ